MPAQEERRFLVAEGDKSNGDAGTHDREETRKFEEGKQSTSIIVGAGLPRPL